jgi:hypothetical protein
MRVSAAHVMQAIWTIAALLASFGYGYELGVQAEARRWRE